MRSKLVALLGISLFSGAILPRAATSYRAGDGLAVDSEQVDQLARDAAGNAANSIKSTYRTIGEVVADYDKGRKQLDLALTKIGANVLDAPVPYLNNQPRLQYRDSLLKQINTYDTRISQLVNHCQLETRAQEHLPVVQARAEALARTIAGEQTGYHANPIGSLFYKIESLGQGGRAVAQQMEINEKERAKRAQEANNPARNMENSRNEVIDADNEQASALQALRNKLQEQADDIMTAYQTVNNQLRETTAHAAVAYDHSVGHKIAALTNTTETLKKQAISFIEKEELNDRSELRHLELVAARSIQTASAEPNNRSGMAYSQSVSMSAANNIVAPQYFPGPNGIGGKTIPGLAIAPPAVPAQTLQFSQPNFPRIPTAQPMQMMPMQMLPAPRQNFSTGYR